MTICYLKKEINVSFSCPVIDNEFLHNIVKVVCESTRLSPRGSTATLTMLTRIGHRKEIRKMTFWGVSLSSEPILTFETSAFESLYGGQLSVAKTKLFYNNTTHRRSTTVSLETYLFIPFCNVMTKRMINDGTDA